MSCVVIGDSIGLGVAMAMPECERQVTVGISAAAFDTTFHQIATGETIISLGSNAGSADEFHIRSIRNRIYGKVIWLLPPSRARDIVSTVAKERGDTVIDVLISDATPTHIHPSWNGYRKIADAVRGHL